MTEPKAPRSREYTHVNADHEITDRGQCHNGMQEHRDESQPAEIPYNGIGELEHQAAKQQDQRAIEEGPEQHLLPGVISAGPRHPVVLIRDVIVQRFPPLLVNGLESHLLRPHRKHVHHRASEDQTYPRMNHPRDGTTG